MTFLRRGWLVVALAAGLGSPAFAKDPVAVKAPASQDDLAYLPADSEIVMGVNFAQIQQSALWKQFVEPVMMKGDVRAKLDEFKAVCGLDPMTTVKSFSFGLKNLAGGKPDGVAIGSGVDRATIMSCMDKLGKDPKTKAKITRSGDSYVIKGDDGNNVAVQIVGTRMIMSLGPNASLATVAAAAKGGSKLKSSAAFGDLFKRIKTGDSMWLVLNGNAKGMEGLASLGAKPKAVFGSVNVTNDVSADIRIRVATAAEATSVAKNLKNQVAAATAFVDKIDVANDNADVTIKMMISNAKLQTLIKMMGGGASSQSAPPAPPPPPPSGGGLGGAKKK